MKRNHPVDWAAARARLEHSGHRLEELSSRKGDRERAFRLRADALAGPEQASSLSTGQEAIVVLRAGKALYGIPISRVAEVLTNTSIAIVPGAPPRFAGVIQARGEIRPVLHLLRALDLPAAAQSGLATVVLLRRAESEMGLLVDQVEDIRWIGAADRQPPPPDAAHASWMTADMLIVLNVDSLLEGED